MRIKRAQLHWVIYPLLCALVMWVAFQLFPQPSGKVGATARQMDRLIWELNRIAEAQGQIPWPTLSDAIDAVVIDEESKLKGYSPVPEPLRGGKDFWGRQYLYIRQSDELVRIRCLGPNGTDDGGASDDLEWEIDLRFIQKQANER